MSASNNSISCACYIGCRQETEGSTREGFAYARPGSIYVWDTRTQVELEIPQKDTKEESIRCASCGTDIVVVMDSERSVRRQLLFVVVIGVVSAAIALGSYYGATFAEDNLSGVLGGVAYWLAVVVGVLAAFVSLVVAGGLVYDATCELGRGPKIRTYASVSSQYSRNHQLFRFPVGFSGVTDDCVLARVVCTEKSSGSGYETTTTRSDVSLVPAPKTGSVAVTFVCQFCGHTKRTRAFSEGSARVRCLLIGLPASGVAAALAWFLYIYGKQLFDQPAWSPALLGAAAAATASVCAVLSLYWVYGAVTATLRYRLPLGRGHRAE